MNLRDPEPIDVLSAHLAALSQRLLNEAGVADADRVVTFAAAAVPHAEHCGVTLLRGERAPVNLAGTGQLPVQLDHLQRLTGQGPCVEAAEGEDLEIVPDLGTDERWPEFAARCVAQTGVHSMLCVRLPLHAQDRAALNFYASEAGVFTEHDAAVASLLAPFAALAVQGSIHAEDVLNYRAALDSSRQIGTAIGILMARERVPAERAYELLRSASQDLNRKVREVAAEVELTGVLPDDVRRRSHQS